MWHTKALGKNGWQYYLLIYMLPVLPFSTLCFAWYIVYSAETFKDIPIPILLIVSSCSAVFFHQAYDVYKFLKIARKTAKRINITNNSAIELELFSNKVIKSDNFKFVSEKGNFSKTEKYKGLFALNTPYITVTINDGDVFYISGTTENYADMCSELAAILDK